MQLSQYLQEAMVTESSRIHINTLSGTLNTQPHTNTKTNTLPRKSHSHSKEVGETKGHRSSVRTACGELLVSRFFLHFSLVLRKHGGPVPIVYTAGSMERIA